MTQDLKLENRLLISFLTLRKTVGLLGMFLPVILFIGGILFCTGLQGSLSAYYHTCMGDVFVGIMFMIGIFLFAYRGYEPKDNIAGNLACIFALGLALFPTSPINSKDSVELLIGKIHLGFALLFFCSLVYFALVLFTKTDKQNKITEKKRIRNKIYKTCAYIMIGCMAGMGISFILNSMEILNIEQYYLIFLFESLAIISFGISWFVKGEGILKDVQPNE